MKWFGCVWIAILIIMWLVWTIKCIKDFIADFRSAYGLKIAAMSEPSWLIWIIVHIGVIFIFSFVGLFVQCEVRNE